MRHATSSTFIAPEKILAGTRCRIDCGAVHAGFHAAKNIADRHIGPDAGRFSDFWSDDHVVRAGRVFWLKLNQPVIQLVNYLASPLQLALIFVFVRIGEWIMRAPRVSFSIPELFRKFHESPANFFREFGLTGLHGIIAWLVIAPFFAALIYFLLLPPLKKLAVMKK